MRGVDTARLAPGWQRLVDAYLASPGGQALDRFVTSRIDAGAQVYPPAPLHALELTPFADVRVVLLGQDPYHGPEQAHGCSP